MSSLRKFFNVVPSVGSNQTKSATPSSSASGAKPSTSGASNSPSVAQSPSSTMISTKSASPLSNPVSRSGVTVVPAQTIPRIQSPSTKGEIEPELPPALSSKFENIGIPGILENEVIVCTGEFPSLGRTEFIQLVTRLGGRVTSAISGKTTMLVYGDRLEDGRPVNQGSKWRAAMERNSSGMSDYLFTLSEHEFFDFIVGKLIKRDISLVPNENYVEKKENTIPSASSSSHKSLSSPSAMEDVKSGPDSSTLMWSEKYRPKEPSDIVGNQSSVRMLDGWLRLWHRRHILKTEEIPKKSYVAFEGAKAVLLHGPPGVGKTSTAHIVAKRYGYDVFELNASDVRAAKQLGEVLGDAVTSSVLNFSKLSLNDKSSSAGTGAPSSNQGGDRRLVVMDEVDGMSAGDRGGISELIKLIQNSRVPIICICNDKNDPKVRSLANHCYVIPFAPPDVPAVVARLDYVLRNEGVSSEDISTADLEVMVRASNSDIRQLLNSLQVTVAGLRSGRSTGSLSGSGGRNAKDRLLRLDAFTATPLLLACTPYNASTGTGGEPARALDERHDLFFVDYEFIPLLVQQLAPQSISSNPRWAAQRQVVTPNGYVTKEGRSSLLPRPLKYHEPADVMVALSNSMDASAFGDVLQSRLRSRNEWGLLQAVGTSVVAAAYAARSPAPGAAMFPQYLGKYSSGARRKRLFAELSVRMAPSVTASRRAVRLDYTDPLRFALFRPLVAAASGALSQAEAVSETIGLLDEYGLAYTDFTETLQESALYSLPDLPAALKTALTRKYNTATHRAQGLSATTDINVTKLRGGGNGKQAKGKGTSRARSRVSVEEELGLEGDGEGLIEDDEEEEEDDDEDEEEYKSSIAVVTPSSSAASSKSQKAKPASASTKRAPKRAADDGSSQGRATKKSKVVESDSDSDF